MDTAWLIPDLGAPLKQGDLLICRNPDTHEIGGICLVITADCDLARQKFGRNLLCLRVIWFEDYIRTTWASKRLEAAKAKAVKTVHEQLRKWHSLKIAAESSLTPEGVTAWVLRAEPDMICDNLGIPEKDSKSVKKSLSCYQAALATLEAEPTKDGLRELINFRATFESRDRHALAQQLIQEAIQQAKENKLPDDVFLLPHLPQLSVTPALVLLRQVVALPFDSIHYRAVDAVTPDSYLRVGRLIPTIKYAVSQAFGNLYSKIGLPTEYENRRDEAVDQLNSIAWE